ncbi:endopeptidase La [Ruminobacter sp.]|uniref:endopeptidase La n=1 Tax=Ruminobacter sp. TaxID=2774296 RepID=UPI003862EB06
MSNETDNNDSLSENTENSEGTVGQQGASGSAGDVMVAEHDRPSVLHVIPVYDRPVLPSEVLPVQLAGKWGETIRQVINGDDKVFAIVARPESELEQEFDAEKLAGKMGCLVRVMQARISDDLQVVVQGISRVKLSNIRVHKNKVITGDAEYPAEKIPESGSREEIEIKAYTMAIISTMRELIPINPLYYNELKQYLLRFNPNDPSLLADCAASITTAHTSELIEVLETVDLLPRLKLALALIQKELASTKLEKSIKNSVTEKINTRQRNYMLKEQMKEIQKELGILVDDKTSEINRLREKMSRLNPPEDILNKFNEELNRMNLLDSQSPEFAVSRDYLNWLTDVPWGIYVKENFSLKHARKILERDHEGLADVKERVLEFLAVGSYRQEFNGAVMLLVGPPGVGKTSIGRSVADALNRPFFRFSLGGMNDEAEIKGHRRTYIGALPGKLVQALKESKAMNPVILLDEIDKLKESYHGDPAGALLETLDPEQNSGFRDHYLDVKIDLSKCLFICTANSLDTIPPALLDRMDAIRLSGYLAEEKFLIAKKHLIPKALEKAGIKNKEIRFQDSAVRKIIDEYARESGVRNLEKCIGRIIRKGVIRLVEKETEKITVKPADIRGYLGVPPFARERTLEGIGIVTGLAWTSVGGATLPVEAKLVDRYAKNFSLTGNLGNVMKESASIALSYISSNAASFGADIPDNYFEKANIHLHVPEGATPKDGPSAGITMASAILSLVLNRAPKANYAMTGELSLTGNVLAIGGIREKVIAAKRVGITNLIVPAANREDVAELPDYVREGVNFNFVDKYEEVARILFDIGK